MRRLRAFAVPSAAAPRRLSERISFDDPDVSRDPFRWYEALRAEGGLVFLPRHQAWIALDYGIARAILSDAESFSSAPFAFIDPVMLAADPADHKPVRRIVSKRFNGEMLRRLETAPAELSLGLLGSEFDVVADFARPISRRTAAALIGFDDEALRVVEAAEDGVAAQRSDAFAHLLATLDALAPRAEAFRDFTGGEDRLTEAQARSVVRLLWVASTATTERTIAQAMVRLLESPRHQQALREGSEELGPFVDEVIRLSPPELFLRREARMSVTVEGVTMPAGAQILISLGAANRDPSVYPDPARFAPGRSPPSLGFGAGIHACVGGPLSRRIVSAAIGSALAGTRAIAPAEPIETIPMLHAMVVFAPRRLRVSAVRREP